jgi:hypothetical protein
MRASNAPSRLALTIAAMRRDGCRCWTNFRYRIKERARRLCQMAKMTASFGPPTNKPDWSRNEKRKVAATDRINP